MAILGAIDVERYLFDITLPRCDIDYAVWWYQMTKYRNTPDTIFIIFDGELTAASRWLSIKSLIGVKNDAHTAYEHFFHFRY